jgi:hypothetical protein
MSDPKIRCTFYDGQPRVAPCTSLAVGFIRPTHSGRLAPLCKPCKQNFISGMQAIRDNKKALQELSTGDAYSEVSLEDGREEFLKQTPTSPEQMNRAAVDNEKINVALHKMKTN